MASLSYLELRDCKPRNHDEQPARAYECHRARWCAEQAKVIDGSGGKDRTRPAWAALRGVMQIVEHCEYGQPY